ncbi:hypothetical protein DK59_999 [Brucella abortus bv. 4 str. 292]|nr:hypothetical protein DK59_999 [Brucella abortus bv. 4 str. 292]KFJ53233.1 hypothetical protein DK47_2064 [Brucella abortus 2308]
MLGLSKLLTKAYRQILNPKFTKNLIFQIMIHLHHLY